MWDNVSENAVNHKVMDAAIAVLREILIALNAYINLFFILTILTRTPHTILSIRSYGRHLYLVLDIKKEKIAFDFEH